MSHCAIRMCSSKSQIEYGKSLGRTPLNLGGIPLNVPFQSICAPPPESRFTRCSRNAFSFTGSSGIFRLCFNLWIESHPLPEQAVELYTRPGKWKLPMSEPTFVLPH